MSDGVNLSNGVNWSKGVNRSNGANWSKGVNRSNGVNLSDGVNESNGVNWSNGVNLSNGVNESNGVNWSDGVNRSNGVNWSDGVNESYGVLNSFGVDKAIFLANKKRTYSIFGADVSKERFNETWKELHNKLNGWYPKFNNAFELYLKNGSDWEKVNVDEIRSTLDDHHKPYEAWKDMPQSAIDYVSSLEEFDAEMFKTITGIDVKNPKSKMHILSNGVKVSEGTIREALEYVAKNNK